MQSDGMFMFNKVSGEEQFSKVTIPVQGVSGSICHFPYS